MPLDLPSPPAMLPDDSDSEPEIIDNPWECGDLPEDALVQKHVGICHEVAADALSAQEKVNWLQTCANAILEELALIPRCLAGADKLTRKILQEEDASLQKEDC